MVSTLMFWRSGLGLLTGEVCQILAELSARDTPIFSFPDDNLSKAQRILTKLGTYSDIKIWFGIANVQISSILDRVIYPQHENARYYRFTFFSKI